MMEDALPPRKCFVTSQTVASSPILLLPLKNKQLLLRHMEFCIRSFVNKMFSFQAFISEIQSLFNTLYDKRMGSEDVTLTFCIFLLSPHFDV